MVSTVKEEAKNDMLSNFMSLMMDKYNGSLGSLSKKTDESHVLLQHILNATVVFDYSYLPVNSTAELVTSCNSYLNKTQTTVVPNANQPSADQLGVCFGGVPYEKPFILEKDGRMSLSLIAVGHKLHYISIAILAVLVIVVSSSCLIHHIQFTMSYPPCLIHHVLSTVFDPLFDPLRKIHRV